MASSRRSKALFAVLLGLAAAALAQAPTRVRGTITAMDAGAITVDGKEKILLGEKTEIVFARPIALAEIQPGDFLGVTSTRRPDGTLTAYEVRRFPKPLNPGHRPFDGRDDQTMTNAAVGAVVQAANGRELTMTYAGGSQKIVVPETASISMLVPGDRAQLVRGAPVSLTHDPNRVAIRIQVSPAKR
jgi:hypothetical protein